MKKTISAVLLACLMVGCTTVITKTPVGKSAVKIDASEWDGVWACEKDIMMVKTIDESKGLLNVATISEVDGKFKIKNAEVSLKSLGSNKFLNIPFAKVAEKKEVQEKFPNHFIWAKFKRQGDNLIVWIPNAEFIQKLIDSKQLTGTKEDDLIILTDSAEKISEVIEKEINNIIIWKNPGVYTRIGK